MPKTVEGEQVTEEAPSLAPTSPGVDPEAIQNSKVVGILFEKEDDEGIVTTLYKTEDGVGLVQKDKEAGEVIQTKKWVGEDAGKKAQEEYSKFPGIDPDAEVTDGLSVQAEGGEETAGTTTPQGGVVEATATEGVAKENQGDIGGSSALTWNPLPNGKAEKAEVENGSTFMVSEVEEGGEVKYNVAEKAPGERFFNRIGEAPTKEEAKGIVEGKFVTEDVNTNGIIRDVNTQPAQAVPVTENTAQVIDTETQQPLTEEIPTEEAVRVADEVNKAQEVPQDAGQNQEAGEVYADVQPQVGPEMGQEEGSGMPAGETGQGVQQEVLETIEKTDGKPFASKQSAVTRIQELRKEGRIEDGVTRKVDGGWVIDRLESRPPVQAIPDIDSTGKPVHSTPEGRENFKRWFVGSTQTNEQGQPTELYHGTADDFDTFELASPNRKDNGWLGEGVYLTNDPRLAGSYANLKQGDAAPNIMPVYAVTKNPYQATLEEKGRLQKASKAEINRWTDELKKQGYDGVELGFADGGKEIVVFEPDQVKSSIGNRGAYEQGNPNLTQSR
jgi:hypothetical protein